MDVAQIVQDIFSIWIYLSITTLVMSWWATEATSGEAGDA